MRPLVLLFTTLCVLLCALHVGSKGGRSGGGRGGSFGRSSGSRGSSRGSSSRGRSSSVSRSVGRSRFRGFATGAATGYLLGSLSSRRYYYHGSGHHYSGSTDFGNSVCSAEIDKSRLNGGNETGGGDIEAAINASSASSNETLTGGRLKIYWECDDNESCCALDCCNNGATTMVVFVIFAILIIVGICVCVGYSKQKSKNRRQTMQLNQPPVIYTAYPDPASQTSVFNNAPNYTVPVYGQQYPPQYGAAQYPPAGQGWSANKII